METLKVVLVLIWLGLSGLVFPTWLLIKATILFLNGDNGDVWPAIGLATLAVAAVASCLVAPGVRSVTVCKIEEV